jgi:hypothetical protein
MSMGQLSAAWPRIRSSSSSKASMAGYENTTRACNSLRVSEGDVLPRRNEHRSWLVFLLRQSYKKVGIIWSFSEVQRIQW